MAWLLPVSSPSVLSCIISGFFSVSSKRVTRALRLHFVLSGLPTSRAHRLINRSGPLSLECRCTCSSAEPHLRVDASFSQESLKKFKLRCKPDCVSVFGREPKLGEAVPAFSATYPVPFCDRFVECMSPHIVELKRGVADFKRPAHSPPRWVGDLGSCLSWRVLLQYRFKKQNHININEELSLRSLLKHAGKTSPNTRFGVFLDFRQQGGYRLQLQRPIE